MTFTTGKTSPSLPQQHVVSDQKFRADTTLDRAIKLDTPNQEYYLTTWSTGDEQDVFEIMSIDAVNDRLLVVPKP
jgi:hypothetical protein